MIDQTAYNQINIERALRGDLGSDLNFNRVEDSMRSMMEGFGYFMRDVSTLTSNYERSLIGNLFNQFAEIIELMKGFMQSQGEDVAQARARQNKVIINKLLEIEKEYISYVTPIVCRIKLNADEGELNKIKQEINSSKINIDQNLSSLENKKNELTTSFNEEISKAKKIVEDARDFSIKSVSKKYGTIFGDQAIEHRNIAYISLIIFILALALAGFIVKNLFQPFINELFVFKNEVNIAIIITGAIYRLTLISILFLFIKEALKSYNVNMNLYNLNKHRQNSLESFDVFFNAQKDSNARAETTKKIVDTIYTATKTGYLSEDKKNIDVSQITELIKALK